MTRPPMKLWKPHIVLLNGVWYVTLARSPTHADNWKVSSFEGACNAAKRIHIAVTKVQNPSKA